MTPLDYLIAVRRRWRIVVGALVVATTVGWFVTRTEAASPMNTGAYRAKVTLLRLGNPSGTVLTPSTIVNLQTVAALVTIGEVPARVAKATGHPDPRVIASHVTATADDATGFLYIEATADTPRRAERLSNAFATQLLDFLKDRAARDIREQLESVTSQIELIESELAQQDPANRASSPNTLQQLRERREQLRSVSVESGFEIIDRSAPESLGAQSFQPPQGRGMQILGGSFLGLLLGIGLALVVERFDHRIRTKHAAERHFGMPVLAEIPSLKRGVRERLVMEAPKSSQANSFRLLAGVIEGGTELPKEPQGNGGGQQRDVRERPDSSDRLSVDAARRLLVHPTPGGRKERPSVILVISAGPSEGKTMVVANLASAFAEAHRTVTVVSCDLRRPAIHLRFGVRNDHGLSEALLETASGPVLNGHLHTSTFPAIRVVPSGSKVGRPGELLSSPRLRQALTEAKTLSDVVLIDSAPLLTATESMHLLDQVDAVLLVARAGRVTPDIAARTSELLRRLGAPVIGVALTFARETPIASNGWFPRWSRRPA